MWLLLHYSVFPFNDRQDVFEALGASQPNDKLYQPCHFSQTSNIFTFYILWSRLDKMKLIGAFEKWSSIKQIFPVFGITMIRMQLRSERFYQNQGQRDVIRLIGGSEIYVKVSGYAWHKYRLMVDVCSFYSLKRQLSVPMFNFYLINSNIKVFVKSTSQGECTVQNLRGEYFIEGSEGRWCRS